MSERFLNPYNFVRPLRKPENLRELTEVTEENRDLHLMWRCPPPPHDRYIGLSGRITCTMIAETPIFVSDSDGITERNKHRTYQFFNVDGEDIIPASSLRGVIRNVFEAATNSCWAALPDQTLSYREITSNANKLLPARLDYDTEQKQWSIVPLKGGEGGLLPTAQVPFAVVDASGYKHGQVCFAIMSRGKVTLRVEKLLPFVPNQPPDIPKQYLDKNKYAHAAGVLCVTGRNIDNKENERFFFRTAATMADAIPISQNVVDRYNKFIVQAREYHADTIQKVKKGEMKQEAAALSRYHLQDKLTDELISPEHPLLKDEGFQFPVYANYNEETGEVNYIAPVSIPRVLETRSFHDIMKQGGFGHLLPATDYYKLSPADRVFGWVSQESDNVNMDKRVAYRGRVRFSHAHVVDADGNKARPQKLGVMALSILSTPKPTTTRFYINPAEGVDDNVNDQSNTNARWQAYTDRKLSYSRRGNMLRGRKVYRHHKQFDEREALQVAPNSDQNRSINGAHAPGTRYTFTVTFENLQVVELGALVWSLALIDGDWRGYHRMGYGKPLGLGSVSISVDNVIYDLPGRYLGETAPNIDLNEAVGLFWRAMADLYGAPFAELDNIRDLMALLSDPELPVRYPRSQPRRHRDGDKNFEWYRDNKRGQRSGSPNLILPNAADDQDGFPYMRWNGRDKRVEVDW